MKLRNKQELAKIDITKPYAFEIVTNINGEITSVAYVTTSEQWAKVIENYTDAWVLAVEGNVARIWVYKL